VLRDAALALDVKPQRGRRKPVPEGGHGAGDRDDRKHDVGDQAQFRLKAASQALGPRLEEIYVARYRACIGEQCPTLICQQRQASAAIEELHA
jgi:hypothetical protein